MLFHVGEVPVGVQQRQSAVEAERADYHIGCLADGNAALPQQAVVPPGTYCGVWIQHGNDEKPAQQMLDFCSVQVVYSTLQNLQQDDVADDNRFFSESLLQS